VVEGAVQVFLGSGIAARRVLGNGLRCQPRHLSLVGKQTCHGAADVLVPHLLDSSPGRDTLWQGLVPIFQDLEQRIAVLLAAFRQLVPGLQTVAEVVGGQRTEQFLVVLLEDLCPAVEGAAAARMDAVDAAASPVSPQLAVGVGMGAPVGNVDGAVRSDGDMAGSKQRIVGLQEVELVGDLEAGAFGADDEGAHPFV